MGDAEFFTETLLEWFEDNARDFPWRRHTDPYKILIAEKLLQQTTYGHVLKVYEKFIELYPNVEDLAKASPSEIRDIIRPLGFHNQRSRQLNKMAVQLIEMHSSKIPETREELRRLDGVGAYVSNAVLCFAYGKDVPIIDMNVRRVMNRYFLWDNSKDKELETKIMEILPRGAAREFNWGVIDFSSQICSRKPKCKKCFMRHQCDYYKKIINEQNKSEDAK